MKSFANENVSKYLTDEDRQQMKARLVEQLKGLYDTLGLDLEDPHLQGTPERVSRLLVDEVFQGRFYPKPKMTVFPNTKRLDELYTVGPITVRSTCAHHFAPVMGKAWIGIMPNEQLMGLSKFHRIVDWIFARPQIQEEATQQLADEIESLISPKGLGIVVKAQHGCLTWRGVKDSNTWMTTSIMRGKLRSDDKTRAEFLALIREL